MDAHIVSQVIGDTFFPLEVFLDPDAAMEFRNDAEKRTGLRYAVHCRPLHTGGWYLH